MEHTMRLIPILILATVLCAEDGPPPAGRGGPSPEAIKAAVEAAFKAGDTDASSTLTRAEFEAAAEAYRAAMPKRGGRKDAPATDAPADTGSTGQAAPSGPPKPTAAQLDAAFAAGDANADKALDKTEFEAAMKALRPPRPARDAKPKE